MNFVIFVATIRCVREGKKRAETTDKPLQKVKEKV